MTNNLVRSDFSSAHVELFVVVRFSGAFTFVVAFAFALALIAVFALALAVVFAAAFAAPFPVAFALAYVIHFHWICVSEVVHDPCLVRVQVGWDDPSQLVVVYSQTVESSPADGLAVSVGPHAAPR